MKKLAKIYMMLLGLCLGAGIAFAVLPWAERIAGNGDSLLMMEALLLGSCLFFGGGAYLITVTLHEAGHLLAGLRSGYRFVSFRIFSIMLMKQGNKFVLKRFRLLGTGGQCLMKPPAWTENGIPAQLYNWGGVLMNLVFCIILLPAVLMMPRDSFVGMFLMVLLAINAYTLLANGVPVMNNDADNAIYLKKDSQAQYAFWQQMMANALLAEGTKQKDFPEELFMLPADADLSNPLIASVAVNAAEHELTLHRFDAAEEMTTSTLENPSINLPPVHRFLQENDLLFLRLLRKADTPEMPMDFDKYRKAMKDFPAVIRTAYAEAVANGNRGEADSQRSKLTQIAKSYPYPQDIEREIDLMAALDQALKTSV